MQIRWTKIPPTEFVGGGGLSTVLGLCLMGVGVTLYTLLFTRKEMMESLATFTWTWGTFLFFLGLLIGFCRHGVRVNRRLDELERWWGFLFIPLKTKKIKTERNHDELDLSIRQLAEKNQD